MHTLFLFLFRIACLILVIGLVKPSYVLFWTPIQTRQRSILIYGPAVILLLLLSIFTLPSKTSTEELATTANLSIVSLDSLMPDSEKQFIATSQQI